MIARKTFEGSLKGGAVSMREHDERRRSSLSHSCSPLRRCHHGSQRWRSPGWLNGSGLFYLQRSLLPVKKCGFSPSLFSILLSYIEWVHCACFSFSIC